MRRKRHHETNETPLADATEAARALKLSKSYLFRLPKDTPGVFKFGTALRFDVGALRQWARQRSGGKHAA
jgi:hypothetical protein